MSYQKAARAAPAIAGNDPRINERLDGGSSSVSTTSPHDAEAANRTRLQFLAARHALGPAPLFHFLDEVERGADLRSHLEEYSQLPVDFVKANRGDQFPPIVSPLREAAHG
jgi:hypothetical protein